ncbi:MAG TPA: hypothetical protein VH333_06190 [Pseudonocardiaceae bacterium]|jgi:hypothetical protein|nr:hypothetical protein [Pseudonocardiaceae bacterium]
MSEPDFPSPPPRSRRSRAKVPAIVVAVLVLVGVGAGVWWFAAGPGHRVSPQPIAAPSSPPVRPPVRPPSSTSASRDTSSAYDVGTCFDEQAGSAPGKVQLNPVECGDTQAVFVINKVVGVASDCDSDASVNYSQHGYEVPDETANVTYCASLVVPVNLCFTLGGSVPIAVASCGSGPNVVQVLSIESAPNVGSACTDKTDPDVWFYQSPTSGQYACVSRPVITATPTAPTTTASG